MNTASTKRRWLLLTDFIKRLNQSRKENREPLYAIWRAAVEGEAAEAPNEDALRAAYFYLKKEATIPRIED